MGSTERAAPLAEMLSQATGYEIVGVLASEQVVSRGGVSVPDPLTDLAEALVENAPVDSVVIPADADDEMIHFVYAVCRDRDVEVMQMLVTPQDTSRTLSVEPMGGGHVLVERSSRADTFSCFIKRLIGIG